MTENTQPGTEGAAGSDNANATRYIRPGGASDRIAMAVVRGLTGLGISLLGSRVLTVRGRKTGEPRSVPVNLLTIDGKRYLVAPRGHVQWVRNLRVAGTGQLRIGRRVEVFTPTELGDEAKPAILRAYLKRWKFEVGMFFDGIDATATDEQLLSIAPGYPIFQIDIAAK
ncbi:MAG TPA: nitroreductase family deazaflavin-dependent oxidoreductase [Pseudonocardiaceae bacterium]|nr:nitroreductase family deazaflavin-dependent oxidoreductase [Pseudonocardiaceae bacterium]